MDKINKLLNEANDLLGESYGCNGYKRKKDDLLMWDGWSKNFGKEASKTLAKRHSTKNLIDKILYTGDAHISKFMGEAKARDAKMSMDEINNSKSKNINPIHKVITNRGEFRKAANESITLASLLIETSDLLKD